LSHGGILFLIESGRAGAFPVATGDCSIIHQTGFVQV
jgi:hypothetical protein